VISGTLLPDAGRLCSLEVTMQFYLERDAYEDFDRNAQRYREYCQFEFDTLMADNELKPPESRQSVRTLAMAAIARAGIAISAGTLMFSRCMTIQASTESIPPEVWMTIGEAITEDVVDALRQSCEKRIIDVRKQQEMHELLTGDAKVLGGE
jgi:hypothetical protein